jgi:DNA-binding NtrC family response regulator
MSSFSQHVDAAPPHLLLIDDDLSLGTLIREYCEGKGLKVTAAASGEEASACRSSAVFNSSSWTSCFREWTDLKC